MFGVMAVKQKQASTTDTYVAWPTSMNGEMILRQHFDSLGRNQTGDKWETVQKFLQQLLDNNLIKMYGVNSNV